MKRQVKPDPPSITDHYKELRLLLVNRSAEKTDKYNARIEELQGFINHFKYGLIKKQ